MFLRYEDTGLCHFGFGGYVLSRMGEDLLYVHPWGTASPEEADGRFEVTPGMNELDFVGQALRLSHSVGGELLLKGGTVLAVRSAQAESARADPGWVVSCGGREVVLGEEMRR